MATALGGCSALDAINVATPNADVIARDVEYSSNNDQRLDVYGPKNATLTADRAPVIVFLHGGGWRSGSRREYRFVASGLAKNGYLVVVPDMRKHPEVRFPDFVNDAADAVNWSLRNAERFGGDPERLFLMGHSSGAHIAALLHYDARYLQRADGTPNQACGFIGLAGPYDFLPLVSPRLQDMFPEELRDDSQPVNFVTGAEPPALLIHGLKDKTVKPRNSAELQKRIEAAGGSADLLIYENNRHASLVLALSPSMKFLAPVLDDVQEFIDAQSCGGLSPTARTQTTRGQRNHRRQKHP
ncbi:MAG: alpha/beta hydrolase [Gammaproteobacteria bacterium]|nr:alpha/beta hydrolase [Gammaproteobacteria bacterium]